MLRNSGQKSQFLRERVLGLQYDPLEARSHLVSNRLSHNDSTSGT